MGSPLFRFLKLILVTGLALACGAVVLSVISVGPAAAAPAPRVHFVEPRDLRPEQSGPAASVTTGGSQLLTGTPLSLISGTLSQDWGDFDRDGYLDLALGTTEGISVYHNLAGQLTPAWSLPGNPAYSVRWADVNGDGRLELISVGGSTPIGSILNPIYRFDGTTFTRTGVITSAVPLARLAALPGAAVDLIASTAAISVSCPVLHFHNNGRGQFTAPATCVSTSATAALGVADVNRDGYPDLVLGRFPNSLVYLKNQGGVLSETNGITPFDASLFWPYDFAWGDYDGDGYLDLAAAFPLQRQVRIYHNQGPGASVPFKLVKVIATQRFMTPLAIDWGDFNGDGALDLAVADDPPKVYFNINQALDVTPDSVAVSDGPSHENQWSIRAASLDNSDLSLALSAQPGPSSLYPMQAGHLQPQITPITSAIAANSVAWGDADGNGLIDLVLGTANAGQPSTLYWNAAGSFSSGASAAFATDGVQSVAIGDLSKRDGRLNAVLGSSSGIITVYTLTNAAPIQMTSWAAGTSIKAVALGDFNNDGWLDLLAGGANGSVLVYANLRGRLISTPVFSVRLPDQVRSVAWTDYDADHYMDFAVATDPGAVYVYHNNQDKTFTLAFTLQQGVSNTAVAWGDFNGDGWPDLAVGSAGQGVSLYENNNGQLSTAPIWTTASLSQTTSLAWGDWNNDSRLDLAVGNADGPVQVFANLGSTPGSPNLALLWSSTESGGTTGVAWGDVNHDGYLDLAVSRQSGLSGVYRNTSVLPWQLPNPPAYLAIQRPGKTHDAYLYSSSELLPGYFDALPLTVAPTVTVYYTAYNAAAIPITNSLFEYSVDGGSHWLTASYTLTTPPPPAITQTSPAGRGSVFIWDVQKDHAISDNALFRIRVVNQAAAGPVQRAATIAVSPPFRVRGLPCMWPAGLSIDYTPKSGIDPLEPVKFIAVLAEPSSDALIYSWDFGDGSNGSGKEVTHEFDSESFYNVKLTAVSLNCPTPQPLIATQIVRVGNPSPNKVYLPLIQSSSKAALNANSSLPADVGLGAPMALIDQRVAASPAKSSACISVPVTALSSPNVPWITTTRGYIGQPALNSDATRVAFWSTSDWVGTNPDGNIEVFYGQIDRINSCITVTQVTSSTGGILEGFNLGPVLNAAGDRIAFFSDRDLVPGDNADDNFEIFLARVTGGGISITQVTSTTDRVSSFPTLDASGTQLAFASDQDLGGTPSNSDGNQEIFGATIDVTGETVLSVTQSTDTAVGTFNDEPALDSSGLRLAFVRGGAALDGGVQEIFMADVGQMTATRVTTSPVNVMNYAPTIGSGGTRLAFASSTVTQGVINLADLSGSTFVITPVLALTPGARPALNADDGSRLTVVANGQQVNVLNLSTNSLMPVFGCGAAPCTSPVLSGDGMHVAFVAGPALYVGYYETANLSITLTSATTPAIAGVPLTYTFSVVNQGPSLADSVEITSALISSPGVTLTMGSTTSPGGICDPIQANMLLVCRFPSLPGGSVLPIQIKVAAQVDPANVDPFTLETRASAWQKGRLPGNNAIALSPNIVAASDLQVKKTAADAVVTGAQLTYTIAITNLGPSSARTVILSDLLPLGTSFVTQTQLSGPTAVLSNDGNQVTNTISVLAFGESAAFDIVADVTSSLGGEKLKNTAIATSDSPDPNPGNNNDRSSVETVVQVAPAIASPASTIFKVGTAGLFTVTATGYQTPALTYTGALPSLVTLIDNGDGTATLSGTPGVAGGGVYHLVITAANNIKPDAVQNFDLTVNEAPTITSLNHAAFTVGVPGTFVVTTLGFPSPNLVLTPSLPSGLTFVDNGNGTATLSGTPALGTVNVYPRFITAENGVSPDAVQPFTLTIANAASGVVVASSPSPAVFGEAVTLSATVSSGSGTPTGSIQFVVDGANYGLPVSLVSGSASLSTTSLAVASHIISATYSGDADFNPATSSSVTQVITKAATTIAITQDAPNPSVVGEPVTASVTVTVNTPGVGTPTGTVTVTDGSKICTAALPSTSCSLTFSSTGSKNLVAEYSGDGNLLGSTSSSVAHTVNRANTTTLVGHTPNSTVVGQAMAVTFTVSVDAPGAGTPTGVVTATDGVTSCTATLPATSCNLTFGSVGDRGLVASYGGSANFNASTSTSVTHTVSSANTTTTLALSKSTAVFGERVVMTATVAALPPGSGVPTGTVTFYVSGTVLSSGLLTSGILTASTAALPIGPQVITATYGGSVDFNGSTSLGVTETITPANTTTALTSTGNPSQLGEAVTFTATVAALAPGAGTPSGNVTFHEGASVLGTGALDANGAATMVTSTLGVGSHVITATYGGDGNFLGSISSNLTQVVGKSGTTTLLASAANPSRYGEAVTFTATVTAAVSGAGIPTGTVTFRKGAVTLGTNTLDASGSATFVTSTLAVGSHVITATYNGNADFSSSVSSSVTQVVTKSDTTVAILNHTPNSTVVGQAVAVTFTVSVDAPGAGTPTGVVTATDGVTSCTATLPATNCNLTFGSVGDRGLVASYGGSADFNVSTSTSVTHTVSSANTTTTLALSKSTAVYGERVVMTATVAALPPGSGVPTGTVTFYVSGTVLSNGLLNSGILTASTAALPIGPQVITATYGGSGDFNGSTSLGVTETITPANTTTALTSAGNPSQLGEAVTFTATVAAPAPGAGTPSGNVTFHEGASVLGTGALDANGAATMVTSTLGVGSHVITATYGGDGNFLGSVSSNLTQVVGKSGTTTLLTSAANPSRYGEAVTFTATVTAAVSGAGIPTGTVTFRKGAVTLGTNTLDASGSTTFVTSTLVVGSHVITATYNGNADFSSSVSSSVTQVVTKSDTTVAIINHTPNSTVVGQAVAVTFTVSVDAPGAGTPTGTVTVTEGSASCTATLPATSCSLSPSLAGTRTLTATYSGNANLNGSISAGVAHTVDRADTTIGISRRSPSSSVVGQSVTVSFLITVTSPGVGTPTGVVTVTDGEASCVATLPASNCGLVLLSTGTKTITATYSGDGNLNRSISPGVTHAVSKANTTISILSDTPDPSVVGGTVTVTFQIQPAYPSATLPTGIVSVTGDDTLGCKATLPATSCTLTFTATGNNKKLLATYPGDGNYNNDTSPSVQHDVN